MIDVVIILIILGLVILSTRYILNSKKNGKSGCGCNCDSCNNGICNKDSSNNIKIIK